MTTRSLSGHFSELQIERQRTWSAEALAANARQRQILVDRDSELRRPAAGDNIPSFSLLDARGDTIASAALVADGPAVIIFYRFGGCPACNIAMPYYDRELYPLLEARGISMLGVSAQNPVDAQFAARHDLHFPLFCDRDYALARTLGLTFLPESRPEPKPGEGWIGTTMGTDSYEMVKPAVLVLEPDHLVSFIDVSPDWMVRTEVSKIIENLAKRRRGARTVEP